MTNNALIKSAATGAVTGFSHDLMLVTTPDVPGREVAEVLGVVRGNTIRARHIGQDFAALFRNMIGGEITEYTKLMAESREQAMDRLVEQARDMGADAVVALRFTTSMVMQGSAELLAYGTAVKLKPTP